MSHWVRVCSVSEAPAPGHLLEAEANGIALCLANIEGELSALDNLCPHRQGPLGQGWIEGRAVVCPWHSWAFDVKTGIADYPAGERVAVFPIKTEGLDILIDVTSVACREGT